jgi:GntR family transcriptional regulator, transcriptional repressor for pyruvate dehydrogenase complex
MTRRPPLSTVVADSLRRRISERALQPGVQLPTEAELCAEYDVSRTVVREAVARLRSEGLVVPQQGRGMFVSERSAARTFSISEDALKTLPETISLLELRLSVEVEAASLCAERRSESEARTIREMMDEVDARQEEPSAVEIHYDFDFHLAIVRAARNEFMLAFLSFLRPMIVPRHQLGDLVAADAKEAYYARIHREHKAIVDAIADRDAKAARRSMRRHLMNSLDRVRALALAAGVGTAAGGQKQAAAALFAGVRRSGRRDG